MANPFVKAWRYLMALFSSKVDEYADPKVQIQQAIEEAQRQHQALTQQAAQVIGNQRQLEMRLNRQLADIEKLSSDMNQLCSSEELKAVCEKAETLAASSVRFLRHGAQIYAKIKEFKAVHSDLKSMATKLLAKGGGDDGSSREEVSTDDGS